MQLERITSMLCAFFCIGNCIFATNHDFIVEQCQKSVVGLDLSHIEEKRIIQPVNHFNKSDTRTWGMRYFEKLENWHPGNPMYIYINGEGEASPCMLFRGLLLELAQETSGGMWATEHRYYGKSQPFDSLTTENLKYLSSRQALADIANLIHQLKLNPIYKSSKVVVIGGSYAGNLAAWMRYLYPDLVDAAISSSAPVLAKVNYFEYLETVGDDFKKYGTPGCFDKINNLFKFYMDLLSTETGMKMLKQLFDICEETDMKKPENQASFFMLATSVFKTAAQFGDIDKIINTCQNIGVNNLKASITLDNNKLNCADLQQRCDDKSGRSWLYQTCTEFGYFQTSPNIKPFNITLIDVNFFSLLCTKCFGINEKEIEEGVKRTNKFYGGLNPNLTNVVFVNGEIDPWHRLGIVKDLSDNAPARVIPGASHCRDLFFHDPNKHKEITTIQREEKDFIKKWIGL